MGRTILASRQSVSQNLVVRTGLIVSLRRYRWLVVSVVVVAGLVGGAYGWYRYNFPFGRNHCCDKQLHLALRNYADSNGGHFPAGEATPEASLSLLYGKVGFDPSYLLCGKTGSESAVQQLLSQGKRLGPKTCGWNYVEGLTLADDSRLALFWDKEGLGHFGQRLWDGGHIVMFVSGFSKHIPATGWQSFLDEQASLRAHRSGQAKLAVPVLVAKVRLPSGEIVEEYDAPFTLSYRTASGYGSGSGPRLTRESLRWWSPSELPLGTKEGEVNISLKLGDWQSDPVRADLRGGKFVPETIILQLKPLR
jgi:hypothetical protein